MRRPTLAAAALLLAIGAAAQPDPGPHPEYVYADGPDTMVVENWSLSRDPSQPYPTGDKFRFILTPGVLEGWPGPDWEIENAASLELEGDDLASHAHAYLRSGVRYGSAVLLESFAGNSGGTIVLDVTENELSPEPENNQLVLSAWGLRYQAHVGDDFTINHGPNIRLLANPLSPFGPGGSILLTRSEVDINTEQVINFPDNSGTVAVEAILPIELNALGEVSCPECVRKADPSYGHIDAGAGGSTSAAFASDILKVQGSGPITVTAVEGGPGEDTIRIGCPDCLTTLPPPPPPGQNFITREEVYSLSCAPDTWNDNHHDPGYFGAFAVVNPGAPVTSGGSAFAGYSFPISDPETAIDCTWRMPSTFQPVVATIPRPVTLALTGFGKGGVEDPPPSIEPPGGWTPSPDPPVPCSPATKAVFQVWYRTFVRGERLVGPWHDAGRMTFTLQCDGTVANDVLLDAEVGPGSADHELELPGVVLPGADDAVLPDRVLNLRIARVTNDPNDTYDQGFHVIAARLSYLVDRHFTP